jgi:hypothetical protein
VWGNVPSRIPKHVRKNFADVANPILYIGSRSAAYLGNHPCLSPGSDGWHLCYALELFPNRIWLLNFEKTQVHIHTGSEIETTESKAWHGNKNKGKTSLPVCDIRGQMEYQRDKYPGIPMSQCYFALTPPPSVSVLDGFGLTTHATTSDLPGTNFVCQQ